MTSTSIENVQAVITANVAVQTQARLLNNRAGEIVFRVMTTDQWKEWLRVRLNGAISCATISDPESLRLPALPQDEVELVREMNPDTIAIIGTTVPVRYEVLHGGAYGGKKVPQVTLGDEFVSGNRWIGLPDEGVKLPGGRMVNIVLKSASSWSALAEGSDIPTLKQAMKNRLNEEQWNRFTDRPAIVVPTAIEETTVLPEIATAVYGTCAVTGESLAAYGTLTASRYWSSDPITWKAEWFCSRTEAEVAFSKAQAELEKAKVESRDKRDREAVQAAAEKAKEKAKTLYGEMPYDSANDLRDRLHTRAYSYLPSGVSELRQWTTEVEAIVAEAEVVVVELKRQKEEKAQQLRKLARPILRPGEQENESTVYGMPCNDEGACEAQSATQWQLYSFRDGELAHHEGFRSSSYGSTLVELIRDYMRGDQDVDAVIASLPREVRKPSELDPIIEAIGGDIGAARVAKEFAEAALQCADGNVGRALRILENESTAPYGRARRQDAIRRNLSGIENIDAGARFLGHGRASDVDTTLAGAVAWLQSQTSNRQKVTVQDRNTQSIPAAAPSLDALTALKAKWGAR